MDEFERDVYAEMQYKNHEGNHWFGLWGSSRQGVADMDDTDRKYLHEALDEWITRSGGTGYFFIGDIEEVRAEFAEEV